MQNIFHNYTILMEFLTKKYPKSPNAQSYIQLSVLEYNHRSV